MEADSFETVIELLHELGQQGVDYVLVVDWPSGFPWPRRATRGRRLFVRPSPDNVDRLKTALWNIWHDPTSRRFFRGFLLANIRSSGYGPPGEVFVIDLLARLGEAFRFEDLEAEIKQSGNTQVFGRDAATLTG